MITSAQRLGKAQDHLLTLIDGHMLHPLAARAFEEMKKAASRDGITLAIASGFRSFDRQLLIWNRKWSGERSVNDEQGHPLDTTQLSDEEKLHAILHWSALPGASRHHWGTDIDVWDPSRFSSNQTLQLVPEEYEHINAPCYPLLCWLQQHAHEFGFFFPYRVYQGGVSHEPWHLSYQPVADHIQQSLTLDELKNALSNTDIAGKETVLAHLHVIKERYFDNICRSNTGEE